MVHIALLLSQNHVRMMEPYPGEGFGFGDRIRLCLLQCYLFCFLPLKYIVLSMTCLWFFRLLIIHAYIGELLLQIRYTHNNSTFFFPFVCEKLFDFFFLLDMVQIISQVSCGAAHVIALSEDGLLQAWGIV